MNEEVVGGDAGLAGIQQLAPYDFAGGRVEVGRAVHDAGTFAAQFERYGGQMGGRLLHHRASEGRTAREEDVVETAIQQAVRGGVVALEYPHVLRREYLPYDVGQKPAGVCRGGGGFQHHAVACGDRARQRIEGELEGVVPRRHDEHHPFRLADDAARRGKEKGRRGHPPAAGPAFQVPQLVADFGQHDGRFADVGLFAGFVQVGVQGLRRFRLAGLYGFQQPAQVFFPECELPGVPFGIEGPHRIESFRNRCRHVRSVSVAVLPRCPRRRGPWGFSRLAGRPGFRWRPPAIPGPMVSPELFAAIVAP